MTIRKAVAVIFQFSNQIFEIQRQDFLKAFPGYTAFPGGKVDDVDKVDSFEDTLLNTLYRETKEELGVDIQELKSINVIREISLFAKATSPDYNPNRYETYFFKIILSKKIEFNVDRNEFKTAAWLKCSELLHEFNTGQRLMVTPVKKIVELLGKNFDHSDFSDLDIRDYGEVPVIEPIKNLLQIMPKSNTLPPASRTNMFVVGDDEKLIVDPSPSTVEEYRNLLDSIKHFRITKIFITHHHKDHHQYSNSLARYLGVPIYISKDSFIRISRKYGKSYFENIDLNFIEDGMIIHKWLGKDLCVISIPGHDEGHFALMPLSKEWCIVGDLFQGVGTVVIGDDEGDMQKYFYSLNKIIDIKPQFIFPSHGIGVGGTKILTDIYRHRLIREEQILKLMLEGKTPHECLEIIYKNTPSNLKKYALKNIHAHIDKLVKENKLKI